MELVHKETQKFLTDHLSAETWEMLPIKKGGSDRNFFRVLLPDQSSFIFMHYGTDVTENYYWADINKFLAGIDIPVPLIIAQDAGLHFILLTDLGNIDLWSQRTLPWDKRRGYYYQVLCQIRKLHAFDFTRIPSGLLLADGYSEKLYRWEHDYFLENFVGAVCRLQISPAFQKELERESAGLIVRLQKIEPSLIHRDLQSQNIMLKDGRPVLIDFQGMRKGCLFYDLGSLICDPYVSFTGKERSELLAFYYDLLRPLYSSDEFISNFWLASAQRLMQALGAYGFLGLKKKKTEFLSHIDNGLANLLKAVDHIPGLPKLNELARECQKKIIK